MKRVVLLLLAAAFAASPATATARRTHKVRVINKTTYVKLTDVAFADNDSSNTPSPGDIETYTVNQFDRQGGTRIGTGHGYCVLGVNPFSTCTTVLKDTRGNRLVMEWDNDATRTTNKFAIVGGTGRYRTSRGEGTLSVQNGDATTYSMKLTIIG
jgi:hypothetical protein